MRSAALLQPPSPPFLGDFGRRGCRESDSRCDRGSEQFWSSLLLRGVADAAAPAFGPERQPRWRRRRRRPRPYLVASALCQSTERRSISPAAAAAPPSSPPQRSICRSSAAALPPLPATVLSPLLLPPYSGSLARAAAAPDSLSAAAAAVSRRPHHFTFVPSFVHSVGRPTRVQSLTAAAAAACPFVCPK